MAIHKDDVINLDIDEIPKQWYNIAADLPVPLPPPLHPGTMQPATAEDLAAIFPPSIVRQEMSTEQYIDIPEEVRVLMSCSTGLHRFTAPSASSST